MVPDSDAYSLYTKLCCLSWRAFFTVPNTSDACMSKHWIISLNTSVNYTHASLHHHPPATVSATMPALPVLSTGPPFLLGHQQLELELEQIFIILYVAMTRPLRLTVRTGSQTFSYMPDQIVC